MKYTQFGGRDQSLVQPRPQVMSVSITSYALQMSQIRTVLDASLVAERQWTSAGGRETGGELSRRPLPSPP